MKIIIFPIIIIGVIMISGWSLVSAEEQQEEKLIINIEGGAGFYVTISNPNDEVDISDIELTCNDVKNRIFHFPDTYIDIGTIKAQEDYTKKIRAFDILGDAVEIVYPIEVVFTLTYGETTIKRTVYCAIYGSEVTIVGIFYNDGGNYEGYTLYTPYIFERTYLINNDGEIVHKWDSGLGHPYGMGVYLTEDGKLLRTEFDSLEQFQYTHWRPRNEPGGMTGRVVRMDWDGNKDFVFPYWGEDYCLHHDIEPLPNGNILMIAWECKDEDDAIAAGLDEGNWNDDWEDRMFTDKIIEVDPVIWDPIEENYDDAIVWEWHAWDHLGEDDPGEIDINIIDHQDFLHANSVEYIEEFDQILLSFRNINEIVVIDHGITTEEAAGDAGDLLYRWGNPMNYGREGDQQLFMQHDARLIESSCPGEGHFSIFNNRNLDDEDKFSTAIEIDPPVDENGFYYLEEGCAYGPSEPDWIWGDENNKDRFFSNIMGGAQRLPNGNTLICDSASNEMNGRIFEVNEEDEIIWQFTNFKPTWIMDPVSNVFKMQRYPLDYPGIGKLESEPVSFITEMTYLITTMNPSYDPLYLSSDIYVSPSSYLQSSQQTVNLYDMSESYYDNITSWVWDFGDGNFSYTQNASHTYAAEGVYTVTLNVTDNSSNSSLYSVSSQKIYIDSVQPEIVSVTNTPDMVGYSSNVTINASVFDNLSGIDTVWVNITYPDNSYKNSTMDLTNGSYYEYVFDDTWLTGQYNYTICVYDKSNNNISSSGHSFNISMQATISVCTIKDDYGPNEMINLTDPPSDPPLIGYEFLDNGDVLHIWNTYNSYYFDTNSGIQLTNHYDEYWSHNVLMLGYYNNDQWNLIYRTDELSGFNKNINSDNETYVNATLWKDLSYSGYDFRLALRYYLGVDDADLTVIPYIKNTGEGDIPYDLGFGWEIKDIRIADVDNDNYLQIYNGTDWEHILLSQTLDNSYTDMDHNTTIRLICVNPPTHHLSRELYLSWNENLTYKVTCKSRTGQYNAPVTLFIKIGTLDVDQEKYTHLYWLDSDDWLGITGNNRDSECGYDHISVTFEKALNGTSFWAHAVDETHWGIVDLGQSYTVKKVRGRSDFMDDPTDVNIYVSENKTSWGTAVTTGISTWTNTSSWVEVDTMDKDGRYIKIEINDTESRFKALSFGNDISPFKIFDVYGGINQAPEISNPFPSNGSTGVMISPMLKIIVSDPDSANISITWLSNSSGSWIPFGTNSSVGNGLYAQSFINASVNGQWWYWNVSVDDGKSTNVSDVFKFYTGYQSKIVNTGSTNISGYLLIQVQYYNTTSSTWVVANDTVNETSPRTINISEQFGLDTVFNGLVNTSSLSDFGSGSYRIYAVFRDPEGNALVCGDESELVATYEFTITFD
jgi:PKD repeat protein